MELVKKCAALLLSLTLLSCGMPNDTQTQTPIIVQTPDVQCVVTTARETAEASHSRKLRKTADKSRNAAVRVYSPDGSIRGSGTYFNIAQHQVILTAAHVVQDMPFMRVVGENGEQALAVTAYIQFDESQDLAILLLSEPLSTREAIDLDPLRDHSGLIGSSVVYTGFPGAHDLQTIFGAISGAEDGNIVMHSYAWPGSSGSAVINEKGKVVGILRAIDLNQSLYGPQLTGDMVWISPLQTLDLGKVIKFLDVYEVLIKEQN